jgi:hypothetical protein
MRQADAPDCVFCGKPIAPDQPMVGRGPMAAHAACADAALADDAHWDAISAGAADPGEPTGAAEPVEPIVGRSGCLVLVMALAAIVVSIALITRTLPF